MHARHGSNLSVCQQGMDKDDVVYVHNGMHSAIKRMKYATYSNMDEPRDYHTK